MRTKVDTSTPDGKRVFYKRTRRGFDDYLEPMGEWLEEAFPGGLSDYVTGKDPTHHALLEVIVRPGDAQSWSWEVAVEMQAPNRAFPRPYVLYWTRAQHDDYLIWVRDFFGQSRDEMADHTRFVESISAETDDPYLGATNEIMSVE
ncbi:hypothetical protein CH273_02155 [Rhodococcus sp. 05-339-2]|uniref:hypothetical protein n=1 Tax=Rhodococcoides fascians TaxID=1828 RepID=UPI00050C2D47|nr:MULTISPECIES: hypothetical protein [Rhodococcus]OZD85583.1 hypothetical protein CH273_02155 [Rhodococcus sp. 05-339-2]